MRVVAEGRWYAARFVEMALTRHPQCANELAKARDCFDSEPRTIWEAWRLMGVSRKDPLDWPHWIQEREAVRLKAEAAGFADPALRKKLSEVILKVRSIEEEEANHVEAALRAAGVDVSGVTVEALKAVRVNSDRIQWPLFGAVRDNAADDLRAMIRKDSTRLNATDRSFDTPIHRAAWRGHREMVELLVAASVGGTCRAPGTTSPPQ